MIFQPRFPPYSADPLPKPYLRGLGFIQHGFSYPTLFSSVLHFRDSVLAGPQFLPSVRLLFPTAILLRLSFNAIFCSKGSLRRVWSLRFQLCSFLLAEVESFFFSPPCKTAQLSAQYGFSFFPFEVNLPWIHHVFGMPRFLLFLCSGVLFMLNLIQHCLP